MKLNDRIMMSFGKKLFHVKVEIENRAAEMNMSAGKYCVMVMTRHIASGERFKVVDGR